MASTSSRPLPSALSRFPLLSGWAGTTVGVLALAGWQLHLTVLRSVIPGLVAMNPATAIGFVLAGLSLALQVGTGTPPRLRAAGRALGAAAGLLGLVKLAGLVSGSDPGLDQLLFRSQLGAAGGLPANRMAPNTALNFALLGAALVTLPHRGRGWPWTHRFALVTLAFSLLAVLGYAYGVRAFYGVTTFIPMALNTGATFLLLSVALLLVNPAAGPAGILLGLDAGALLARRLLAVGLLAVSVLGFVELRGHAAGLYEPSLGVSLLVVAIGTVLAAVIWSTATTVRRISAARDAAAAALATAHAGLEVRVAERTAELEHANRELVREAAVRRDAEARLVKLSRALEQAADAVVITNRDGTIEYVNPAFEAQTGWSRAEAVGQTPRILKSGRHDAAFYAEMWRTVLAGEVYRAAVVNRRKDGEVYTAEKTITPLRDENGAITHFVMSGRDVTERMKLEDQLRQSQKMEAIGRLAGGVAHDFNNLLTAIMGHTQLTRRRLKEGDRIHADLGHVLAAAERAAGLTRQLLAFSRQQVLQPRVVNLNGMVQNLEKMLRRLIGEDIDFVTALDPALGRVLADPGQIDQVVMNLVVNARDAMERGGRLTIETGNVTLDEEYVRTHPYVKPGRYVMVAVTDTGTGMTREIRARIFEPFFTTKEQGKGTGLGLSTVMGIVKQSNGSIEVYSEPGHGTAFRIYLPRVDAEVEPVAPAPSRERLEGTETILLVEDEQAIRSVLVESLRIHGYTVLEAVDGSEAIVIADRRDLEIALVVTDVVMPLMNGPELVNRLLTGRPDLRVLFVSGYTDRALIHQGLRHPGAAFLQKPFTPETLARKVRDLLDQPRARAA